jgi:hypothetical protein
VANASLWGAVVLAYWLGAVVPSMRPDGMLRGDDLYGYFFPKYVLASRLTAPGHLPLWNPYEFAGVPLLGMSQPAALYPPRLLLFGLLPPDYALQAFVVAHYLLLGLACFTLAHALRIGTAGAWLMTIVIAAQPMMLRAMIAPHWIAGFVWVPFALAAALRLADAPGRGPVLGLALAMTGQLVAGYPEYALDTGIALGAVWVCTLPGAVRRDGTIALARSALAIAGAATLALLLCAPQLSAFLETYRESVREATAFPQSSLEILLSGGASLETIAAMYVAVPPLAVLGLGMAFAARDAGYRGTMLAVLALSIAGVTVLHRIPPFSMSRSGILCWGTLAHVAVGALAGIGLDRFLEVVARRRTSDGTSLWRFALFVGAVSIPTLLISAFPARLVLVASVVLLGILVAAPPTLRGIVIGLVLAPLLLRVLATDPAVQLGIPYPSVANAQARGRLIAQACNLAGGGRVVAPEETFAGVLPLANLPSPQGYPESLMPRRMGRLLEASGLGMSWTHRIDWQRLIGHPALLEALDVRCVVAPPWLGAQLARIGFQPGPVATPDGRLAFRHDGSAARLIGHSVLKDADTAFAAVTDPAFSPARDAIVEGGSPAVGTAGHVKVLGPTTPGYHRFRTSSRGSGYLVVSETWYPGWRALIDGHPAEVTRVNYAFVGVQVPRGTHAIELWYRPVGFDAALILAAVGAFGTLVVGYGMWQASRRCRPAR